MQALAEQIHARQTADTHLLAEERKRKNYADFWNAIPITEPFRVILSDMRDRLYHTREVLHPLHGAPQVGSWHVAQKKNMKSLNTGVAICCV